MSRYFVFSDECLKKKKKNLYAVQSMYLNVI